MSPHALNIVGSTQPEAFRAVVEQMVQAILADPGQFWQTSLQSDGPIEVWEINGDRFLFNGNHRFQAAAMAGADIPEECIVILDRTGSTIPTFRLDQQTWL